MLYFYGMTVVEVVRRKEFGTSLHRREMCKDNLILLRYTARFFYQRAQSILEIMAKLS